MKKPLVDRIFSFVEIEQQCTTFRALSRAYNTRETLKRFADVLYNHAKRCVYMGVDSVYMGVDSYHSSLGFWFRIQSVPVWIFPSERRVYGIASLPGSSLCSKTETKATVEFYCRCSSHDEIQAAADLQCSRGLKLGPYIPLMKKYCPNLKLSRYRYNVQEWRRNLQQQRCTMEDLRRAEEDQRRTMEDRRRAKEDRRRMMEDRMDSAWSIRQSRLERQDMAPDMDEDAQEGLHLYQEQWEHEGQDVQQNMHNQQELQNEDSESKTETAHEDIRQVHVPDIGSLDLAPKSFQEDPCELSELSRAMRQSNEDLLEKGLPLSSDGVVILRLTKRARAREVLDALQASPILERCHNRLKAAGCVMMPEWTEAKLLVPVTQELLNEFLEASDLQLTYHHIIALSEDIDIIKAALRTISPNYKQCPRLKPEHPEAVLAVSSNTPPLSSEANEEVEEVDDGHAVNIVTEQYYACSTDSDVGFPCFRE